MLLLLSYYDVLAKSTKPTGLPLTSVNNGVAISDKVEMLNSFSEHFISSGFLFDSVAAIGVEPINDAITTADNSFKPNIVSLYSLISLRYLTLLPIMRCS